MYMPTRVNRPDRASLTIPAPKQEKRKTTWIVKRKSPRNRELFRDWQAFLPQDSRLPIKSSFHLVGITGYEIFPRLVGLFRLRA